MTDTVAAEALADQMPPVPPALDVAAEVEAGPGTGATTTTDDFDNLGNSEVEAAEAPGAPAPERALPEIEHAIGPLRRAILDHLLDTAQAGPQSVAEVLQAMPIGTSRNTLESALRRSHEAGHVERVAPGRYALSKPQPVGPPKPAPPPTPEEEALVFDALERWAVDPASWNVAALGPAPDDENTQISLDIRRRFFDRVRKREQRRRDAEAAGAKQAEADRQLRDRLIAVTYGNYLPGPGLDDVAPIKRALELVPLDRILSAIRCKTDKKLYPKNEPAASWRESRLLKEIAESYCRSVLVPSMVAGWSAAGRAPQKPVDASEARAGTQEPAAHHVAGVGPGSAAYPLIAAVPGGRR
jgi:hypothetical protein